MKRILIITFGFASLVSCIPTTYTSSESECTSDEQYNTISRECERLTDQAPRPTLSSEQIYEDSGANSIALTYYDVDSEAATLCQIVTYGAGIDDTPPNPCTCISGTCSVPVTPDSNYFGSTSFSYRIADSNGYSEIQIVYLTVNSVNDAPVIVVPGPFSVNENSSISDTVAGATDNDVADTHSYSLISAPAHGSMITFSSNGAFIYDPDDDSTDHSDDTETLYYRVCDNGSPVLCDTGTMTITVNSINDAPVRSTSLDTYTTTEDVAITVTVPVGTDPEGDTLIYLVNTNPSNGSLDVNCLDTDGVPPFGSRSCTYTPNADYDQSDYFTYKICDDYDADNLADDCSSVVTVVINMTPVNDAPTAPDLVVNINEDNSAVETITTATDVDDDDATLTYQVVTNPTYGSVSFTGAEYTYVPNDDVNEDSIIIDGDASGDDTFTYQVCDDESACSVAGTVTINITAVEDDPTITMPSPYDVDPIPTVSMNEGGTFNLLGIKVDEGGGSDEDAQTLEVDVTVATYGSSIPYDQIMPADLNDNSHIDVQYGGVSVGGVGNYPLGGNYVALADGPLSGDASDIDIFLTPVGGESGIVEITISLHEVVSGTIVTQVFYFDVNAVTALHGGWKHIKAIGAKRDKDGNVVSYARDSSGDIVTDSNGYATYRSSARVELEWNAMTIAGSDNPSVSITGWQIFRRLTGEDYDWDAPHATISSASTREYVDTDFTDAAFWTGSIFNSTVLYYTVRPIDSDESLPVPTQEVFSEIRVIAPADNMVFVHRWIVNQEVCDKMHLTLSDSTIDPVNNFRCAFAGPGDTAASGYYDVGYDMLVDIAETGCPYTDLGLGDPNTAPLAGSNGDIYYDRSSGDCFIYDDADGGTDWDKFSADATDITEDSLSATEAEASAAVELPPLVNITAVNAAAICELRTGPTVAGVAAFAAGDSKLPSRRQQMGYSSWSSDISDTLTTEYEEGSNINSTSKCNSSSADGVDSGYSDATTPGGSYLYSLPGSGTSSIRSIYTGSEELGSNKLTPACASRYGVQDVYGNVGEWVSDRIECGDTLVYECHGLDRVGSNNPTATDWQGYSFDNDDSGACVDTDSDGTCDGFMDSWYLKDETYVSTQFSLPLGLPYYGSYSSSDTVIPIGTSSTGITSSELRGDYVTIDTEVLEQATAGEAGIVTGGGYLSVGKSGRYSMEFVPVDEVAGVAAAEFYYHEYCTDVSPCTTSAQGIQLTANAIGSDGNNITITIEDDNTLTAPGDSPVVSVSNLSITVNADTTIFTGHSTDDIVTAITGDSAASALVAASNGSAISANPATYARVVDQGISYFAAGTGPDGMTISITLTSSVGVAGSEVATVTGPPWAVSVTMEDGLSTPDGICDAIDSNTAIATLFTCQDHDVVYYANGVEYVGLSGTVITITDNAPSAITSVDAVARTIAVDLDITGLEDSDELAAILDASGLVSATAITNDVTQVVGAITMNSSMVRETLVREDVTYTTTSAAPGGEKITINIAISAAADSISVDQATLTVDINLDSTGLADSTTVEALISTLSGDDAIITTTGAALGTAQSAASFTIDADYAADSTTGSYAYAYNNGVKIQAVTSGSSENPMLITITDNAPTAVTAEDGVANTVDVDLDIAGGEDSDDLAAILNSGSTIVTGTVINSDITQIAGTVTLSSAVREQLAREDVTYSTTSIVPGGTQVTVNITNAATGDSISVTPATLTVDINLDPGGAGVDSTNVEALIATLVGSDAIITTTGAVLGTAQTGFPISFTVDADYGVERRESFVSAATPAMIDSEGDYFTVATSGSAVSLSNGTDAAMPKRADIGFRCVIPVLDGDYDADTNHTYGY